MWGFFLIKDRHKHKNKHKSKDKHKNKNRGEDRGKDKDKDKGKDKDNLSVFANADVQALRFNFFGEKLESIRPFHIETQITYQAPPIKKTHLDCLQ